MAKPTNDLGDFLSGLPTFQVAPPKPKALTQEEKVRRLAGPILTRLFRDGTCRIEDLEADAREHGISGRLSVTLGAGVGGKGGMRAFCDGGQVVPCKDNVLNCISRLGRERFARWLADAGVELAAFQGWLNRLP